jgi:hypothetical protein
MKKSDLKTGMRVKLQGGQVYIVVLDYETTNYGHQDIFFISKSGFMVGSNYDEDLVYRGDDSYDIIEVYSRPLDAFLLDIKQRGELLWKRQPPKEMTLAEIEKMLGYPVKIIGERS